MCAPVLIALGVAAAGASIYGAVQQGNAAKQSARAIAEQNAATMEAQNKGFTQRLAATGAQTDAQTEAQRNMLLDETNISNTMRDRQGTALTVQQDILGAMNKEEGGYADAGKQAANLLLDQTDAGHLAQSQTDWQTQAASLLDASSVPALSGATEPGGTGDDPYTKAALARRAAEAATNIRSYGAKAARVSSYAAPLDLLQNETINSATGIMPAQQASKLLVASAPTILEPAQTAWGQAKDFGQASLAAANQAGQGALGLADLQYKNSTDIANLGQANATVTADNIAKQRQADAAWKASMGGVISGIGNLGMQALGYYGKLPGFLDMNKTAVNLPNGPVGDFNLDRKFA